MAVVGEVWRHSQYYTDPGTGELLPKFLVILAVRPDGDLVYKLLTSQEHQRPKNPPCDKDGVHPGFYVGVPSPVGDLFKPTWLDLRESEDFDSRDFAGLIQNGTLTLSYKFQNDVLCPALRCAAYAPDTTKRQSSYIMDAIAKLGCR